jgi:hypothetical protein
VIAVNDLLKLAIEGHGGLPRVYVRNPDGSPVLDSTSIAVDVTDVTFS